MFKIYMTNFGYPLQESFKTLEAAIARARKAGFQASIYEGENLDILVATFCPLAGVRKWKNDNTVEWSN